MITDAPLQIYRQTICHTYGTHWHEFYELGFVLDGYGEHTLNGVTSPLQRGSIFLLTPADFHALSPRPQMPLQLFDVVFHANMLKEEVYRLLFQDLKSYQLLIVDDDIQEVEREFERLWSESRLGAIGSQVILLGTLERILIDLLRKSLELAPPRSEQPALPQHHRLSMSLIYLHHHFRESLSLEEVAKQVHLSPSYFSECFHHAYGKSFQSYLLELRLSFAASLLATAPLSISHICSASGFSTLSHFERAFKAKFGLSPRQFSKMRHEQEQTLVSMS